MARSAEPLPLAAEYAPGQPYHPTCLAFTDANDTLAVGNLSGAMWRQRPARPNEVRAISRPWSRTDLRRLTVARSRLREPG
jgi:hypothetical protein